jgi:hypothetical protein
MIQLKRIIIITFTGIVACYNSLHSMELQTKELNMPMKLFIHLFFKSHNVSNFTDEMKLLSSSCPPMLPKSGVQFDKAKGSCQIIETTNNVIVTLQNSKSSKAIVLSPGFKKLINKLSRYEPSSGALYVPASLSFELLLIAGKAQYAKELELQGKNRALVIQNQRAQEEEFACKFALGKMDAGELKNFKKEYPDVYPSNPYLGTLVDKELAFRSGAH